MYAEKQGAMDLWNKLLFCLMQHVIFAGTKIKSDLSRYNWPCGIIRFNSNSGALKQVSIASHFSNLIFSFLGEVSSSLEVTWPHNQEVRIRTFRRSIRIWESPPSFEGNYIYKLVYEILRVRELIMLTRKINITQRHPTRWLL